MKLLDLPTELLQAIAEETVIALGPFKAQRVRLVNKFLSRQILQATFATRIMDSHPSYECDRMSTSMIARHLETRTFTDPRGINEFTTSIQRTVDLLLKDIEQKSDELRLRYTRVLCAAAADYLDSPRHDYTIFKKLKKDSISIDHSSEDVKDLFAAAAHVGNSLLLKSLIDKGVDINAQSQYFGRALRGAAFGGHCDALLLLLDHGADPNADSASTHLNGIVAVSYYCHSTPLQAAALAGHESIVRLLLDPKYHVSDSGFENERTILYATRGGHLCLVRFLMNNVKIMDPKQLQRLILVSASRCGHEPIVQMMLDLDTDPNVPYGLHGSGGVSPLRAAAAHNFHNIVQLLLAKGADPNKGGEDELWTPFYAAVRGEHERVAQTLLDHGADINAGLNNPLRVAARRGTLHMVHWLLERGAALDTEKGDPVLAIAASRGHEPMVRLLVKFGASADDSEEEPNRAMLLAMWAGHHHVVKTLIVLPIMDRGRGRERS